MWFGGEAHWDRDCYGLRRGIACFTTGCIVQSKSPPKACPASGLESYLGQKTWLDDFCESIFRFVPPSVTPFSRPPAKLLARYFVPSKCTFQQFPRSQREGV